MTKIFKRILLYTLLPIYHFKAIYELATLIFFPIIKLLYKLPIVNCVIHFVIQLLNFIRLNKNYKLCIKIYNNKNTLLTNFNIGVFDMEKRVSSIRQMREGLHVLGVKPTDQDQFSILCDVFDDDIYENFVTILPDLILEVCKNDSLINYIKISIMTWIYCGIACILYPYIAIRLCISHGVYQLDTIVISVFMWCIVGFVLYGLEYDVTQQLHKISKPGGWLSPIRRECQNSKYRITIENDQLDKWFTKNDPFGYVDSFRKLNQ